MIDKICIIGVGLIGGSFALGLKKAAKVKTIIGFGRHENNLKTAQKLGVIDHYSLDIEQALNAANIVLIATPVNSFESILRLIKPHIDDNVIISDVGSTKGSVVNIAKRVFAQTPLRFIPAHPIAGKEKSGVRAADATLFEHKRVILTPQHNADTLAIQTITELWQALGAQVETMTEQKHDDLLAMTSHLPHILAFSLMDYLMANNPNAQNYAAGGFKDFSRIASSNSLMWRDVCLHNPEEIIKHIKGYQQTLDKLSGLIENHHSDALEELFSAAKSARDSWIEHEGNAKNL